MKTRQTQDITRFPERLTIQISALGDFVENILLKYLIPWGSPAVSLLLLLKQKEENKKSL